MPGTVTIISINIDKRKMGKTQPVFHQFAHSPEERQTHEERIVDSNTRTEICPGHVQGEEDVNGQEMQQAGRTN